MQTLFSHVHHVSCILWFSSSMFYPTQVSDFSDPPSDVWTVGKQQVYFWALAPVPQRKKDEVILWHLWGGVGSSVSCAHTQAHCAHTDGHQWVSGWGGGVFVSRQWTVPDKTPSLVWTLRRWVQFETQLFLFFLFSVTQISQTTQISFPSNTNIYYIYCVYALQCIMIIGLYFLLL